MLLYYIYCSCSNILVTLYFYILVRNVFRAFCMHFAMAMLVVKKENHLQEDGNILLAVLENC